MPHQQEGTAPDEKKGAEGEGQGAITSQDPEGQAAQGSTQNGGDTGGEGEEGSKLSWTPEQKAYIETLRKENAKHRTDKKALSERLDGLESGFKKALGIEDETNPEDKLKQLTSHNEEVETRLALLETAIELGVNKDQMDYFQFLVAKELGELEEGDEISEETLIDIAKKANGVSGAKGNTSVSGSNTPIPEGGDGQASGDVTLDQFVSMGMNEKSALFGKNPDLYKSLAAQAKKAGKFI